MFQKVKVVSEVWFTLTGLKMVLKQISIKNMWGHVNY